LLERHYPSARSVTVKGTHFTGATSPTFAGKPAASFTVVDDSTITATVGNGTKSGQIAVTTSGGTATSTDSFITGRH
jgi:hypothetical protein